MNVYVITEHLNGNISDHTFELLGKASQLASGGSVTALLAGHGAEGLASQLGSASKVLYADHPQLSEFNPEAYCKAFSQMLKGRLPGMVMVPYSSMGMDLASGLALSLDIPVLTYAHDININGGKVSVVSQMYGGKLNVESEVAGDSCIVAVLAGMFPADAGKASGNPSIEKVSIDGLDSLKVQFKKLITPEAGDVDITQVDILVSVGRGIQSDENLPMVEELAAKLGGAISASRPIIDNKWLPKTRQVGKSGLKVKPKVYLALGISGAPEHIEGMKDSELIIAVNTDPNAPIFDYANYGVTADLFDVVPALTAKL